MVRIYGLSATTSTRRNSSQIRLEVKVFEKPMAINGAFTSEGQSATASRSVTLAVNIFVPGSNIPVRIRGVKFIIMNLSMDEIILGRPLLKAMGFDLNKNLE